MGCIITALSNWNDRLFYGFDARRVWTPLYTGDACSIKASAWTLCITRMLLCGYLAAFETWNWATVSAHEKERRLAYLTHLSYWMAMLYFFCTSLASFIALRSMGRGQSASWYKMVPTSSKALTVFADAPGGAKGPGADIELASLGASTSGASMTAGAASSADSSCLSLRVKAFLWRHLIRTCQVMHSVALPAELLVLLLYWLVLFDPKAPDTLARTTNDWYADVTYHATSCALVFIDHSLLGTMASHDLGVLITFAGAVFYLLLNLIVTKAGYPVYSILTWNDGKSAGLIIGSLIAIVVFFYLWAVVAWVRDRTAARCARKRGSAAATLLVGGAANTAGAVARSASAPRGAAARAPITWFVTPPATFTDHLTSGRCPCAKACNSKSSSSSSTYGAAVIAASAAGGM